MKEKTKIASGAYEGAKANNIYDLAGNVFLWTLEADGSRSGDFRYCRSGSYVNYGTNVYASNRGFPRPYDSNNFYGFCGTLYIK